MSGRGSPCSDKSTTRPNPAEKLVSLYVYNVSYFRK